MSSQYKGPLIINSPYEEPQFHLRYEREERAFYKEDGRRAAGYVIATPNAKAFDDPGIFKDIPVVNQIRERVKEWREDGYPGVTGITKRLLEHWYNPEERTDKRFFFCQLEAIETLIWLCEAPSSATVGLAIGTDGGPFSRLCSKMATGSGKTIVMAMLIAWQVLNKVTYPQDARFSKNIFVVAPGLTVKSRLQVLLPSGAVNYYDEFNVVPSGGLKEKLRQGKILIRNWHALAWETEAKLAKKKSVDKRGPKSNEAYVREVLEEIAGTSNIVVINDEAHHAWRVPAESKIAGVKKADIEEATIWVSGLDRIHQARRILTCYDFSATPFAPSGKKTTEEALFTWIVSDFGLNDAIESGLVKTPRVVIRDDGAPDVASYRSKLYHIYEHVKDDLNRKAEEQESLPDLVINGYYLLGKDWLEAVKKWKDSWQQTPPVMITVANRTETAARVKYAFDRSRIRIDELCIPERILHIDSKVLDEAESQDEATIVTAAEVEDGEKQPDKPTRKLSKKELAEKLRQTVDTVGQVGKPGEQIQKVISVGMLSEGWDAKTVTHIMGLRAFTSQLLCEQVVGRGLRRTSYEVDPETGLFQAEYVNIFGVPFTFLPHEAQDGPPPPPPPPKTKIEPVAEKKQFEISWPCVIRIDHVYTPTLTVDLKEVKPLNLNAYETRTLADLAPIIEGKPDITKIEEINLADLAKRYRLQKIIFETSRDVYDQMKPADWKGNREFLLAQIIRIVEQFLRSEKIKIYPPLFYQHEDKRRIMLTLNMTKVVRHIWEAIRFGNTESIVPVFDSERPIRSTGDMRTWFTGKPCEYAKRSHINFCVFDSTWEASEMFELDRNSHVTAWVKNDHLNFEILYIFDGLVKKYRPDFLIRLTTGQILIMECKGIDTQKDKTKRRFLDEWVIAVNDHGGFGKWQWAVSKHPKDVPGLIEEAVKKQEG